MGCVQERIEERVFRSAFYIIRNRCTIRDTAKAMGVSKSTTHLDLQERLGKLDPVLQAHVHEVIEWNSDERYSRGGQATKIKYETKQGVS